MSGFSEKILKQKLRGNELDLSLSELTDVPVKSLMNLSKATHLDLSCNHLRIISDDFCSLIHLVHLDLSQNELQFLPNSFGKLINLQHLDLYKNHIKNLPISFGHLKSLKWLDLKDNPLNDTLRTVAGDCLDEKQCVQAAQKVVKHMAKIQSDEERDRQKKLKEEKERELAKKNEDDVDKRRAQAEKKKQKEQRKLERQRGAAARQTDRPGDADVHGKRKRSESSSAEDKYRSSANAAKKVKMSKSKTSFCRLMCTVGIWLSVLSFFVVGAVYNLCSGTVENRPTWVPNPDNMCRTLYASLAQLKSPPWLEKKIDGVYDHTVQIANSIGQTLQPIVPVWMANGDWVSQESLEVVKQKARDVFDWTTENVPVYANFTWVYVKHAANVTGQYTSETAVWVFEKSKNFTDDWPHYWERIKFYWKNLK